MNKTEIHVGNNISKLLDRRDISKTDLAKQLGISRVQLYRILNSKDINTSMLKRFQELFNEPMNYFLSTPDEDSQKLSDEVSGYIFSEKRINEKIKELENHLSELKKENDLLRELLETKNALLDVLQKKK